jgi:hypothetical protein
VCCVYAWRTYTSHNAKVSVEEFSFVAKRAGEVAADFLSTYPLGIQINVFMRVTQI